MTTQDRDVLARVDVTRSPDPWGRWRTWWRVIGSVVAAVMLVVGLVNVVGMFSERTEVVDQVLPAEGLRSLRVEVQSSELEVVRGAGDELIVSGTITSGFRRTDFSVTEDDGKVLVRLDCRRGPLDECGGDLRIEVPPELDVSVDAPESEVALVGLEGDIDVRSTNNAIGADGLDGRVRLHATNAPIVALGLRSSDVEVTSSNDRVELSFERAPRSVVVRTSNDEAKVILPDSGEFYDLQLSTSNAQTTAEVRTDPDSDRRIEVTTSNDDIVVTYPG